MSINTSPKMNALVKTLFKSKVLILALFTIFTALLMQEATKIKLDASFTKNIPLNHSYMKTYIKHQANFGGANNVLISVCNSDGNLFNASFFNALKGVHDQLFFIQGIERTQVKSLFSPSTRFVEIVEDGFAGGPVIPANFSADKEGLLTVKQNIEKAGIVGSIVSDDYSCSMVKASLMDVNPETGEKLDTINIAKQT